MPDFVQTAPVDTTTPGLIRGMTRKQATKHDILWIIFVRTPRWLLLHPVTTAGIAAGAALWIKGLPFLLALTVAGIVHLWTQRHGSLSLLAAVYRRREYRRILSVLSNWWRIRTGWSTGTTSIGFRQPGRNGRLPWLRHWEITRIGLAAQVTPGRFGWTATRLAGGAETIAAGIEKCRRVIVTEGDTPGLARIDFAFADPLAAIIPVTELALPKPRQIMCGVTEHGEPAAILNYLSTLVVGTTGSGKSNLLWTQILSALASGQPIEIWAMDPAGGVELHKLRDSPLTKHYAESPAECTALVHELHAAMVERTRWMSGKTREHVPTKERPRLWLVIDEILLVTPHLKGEAMQKFVEILSTGRKAAVTVTALTQIPFSYAVGEKIRPLFAQKVVLRAESTLVTVNTLGPGSEALGAKASAIKPTMQGVGYLLSDDYPQPVRFRSPYLSDEMVHVISRGVVPDGIPTSADVPTAWHNFEHVLYRWDTPPEGVALDPKRPEERYVGVLYVGISIAGLRRADEHLSNDQKAVLRTPGVTMTIADRFNPESCVAELAEGLTVKAVAERVEAGLIRELEPPLNVAHNPGRKRRARAAVGA